MSRAPEDLPGRHDFDDLPPQARARIELNHFPKNRKDHPMQGVIITGSTPRDMRRTRATAEEHANRWVEKRSKDFRHTGRPMSDEEMAELSRAWARRVAEGTSE